MGLRLVSYNDSLLNTPRKAVSVVMNDTTVEHLKKEVRIIRTALRLLAFKSVFSLWEQRQPDSGHFDKTEDVFYVFCLVISPPTIYLSTFAQYNGDFSNPLIAPSSSAAFYPSYLLHTLHYPLSLQKCLRLLLLDPSFTPPSRAPPQDLYTTGRQHRSSLQLLLPKCYHNKGTTAPKFAPPVAASMRGNLHPLKLSPCHRRMIQRFVLFFSHTVIFPLLLRNI